MPLVQVKVTLTLAVLLLLKSLYTVKVFGAIVPDPALIVARMIAEPPMAKSIRNTAR